MGLIDQCNVNMSILYTYFIYNIVANAKLDGHLLLNHSITADTDWYR